MRPRPEPGGPGGKYLGGTGPMTAAELREALSEIREQVDHEPAVLEELGQAILSGDLATTAALLEHLRDFFTVLGALLALVDVAAEPKA